MNDRLFTLDTSILVHAMDRLAGDRHVLGSRIIDRSLRVDCCLTLQSISEFYAAVTRRGLVSVISARDQALDWLDMFPTIAASPGAVRAALTTAASGRASYWDALLAYTAAEAGCAAILTEHLSDGTEFSGMRVINPFAGTSLSAEAEALLSTD